MRRNLLWAAAVYTALVPACSRPAEPPGTGSLPGETRPPTTPTVAPVPPTPAPSAADETALRELSDRYVRGLLHADADTVASVYSLTAEVFAPDARELLLGQRAVRGHYARWFQSVHVERFDLRRSAFVVRPEVAYSFGVWHALIRPVAGGEPAQVSGRVTDIYRRTPGGPWVVAHEHASLVLEDSAVAGLQGQAAPEITRSADSSAAADPR